MFFFHRPSDSALNQVIQSQVAQPFTYSEVGATQNLFPRGYVIDRNRVKLGQGEQAFLTAKQHLLDGNMFKLGWLEACWPSRLNEGQMVATLAHVLGLWVLNVCRVIYLVEEDGALTRFGFAYGTLPEHVMVGEERFVIEWNRHDDSVWYDILAFSRPSHILAYLGHPIMRERQRRFGRDSLQVMQQGMT